MAREAREISPQTRDIEVQQPLKKARTEYEATQLPPKQVIQETTTTTTTTTTSKNASVKFMHMMSGQNSFAQLPPGMVLVPAFVLQTGEMPNGITFPTTSQGQIWSYPTPTSSPTQTTPPVIDMAKLNTSTEIKDIKQKPQDHQLADMLLDMRTSRAVGQVASPHPIKVNS